MPSLHHTILPSGSAQPSRTILVLHGILGSGNNLRGLAQGLVAADPSARCVLVDLRMHGRSQGFSAPHHIDACASDLVRLSQSLDTAASEVIGHSFGGKVALAFAEKTPELRRVALIDSSPFERAHRRGSEHTLSVVEMLEGLPEYFVSRPAFVEYVMARGFSRMIADWLAMNLDRADTGFRFRLDMSAIRALIDDYFVRDFWHVVEHSAARMDLVIGGRSDVWQPEDLARAHTLQTEQSDRVHLHVLPQAGHWVHVDDPEGLLSALI